MPFAPRKAVIFILALATVAEFQCDDKPFSSRINPSVDTRAVTEINTSGVTLNGEILQLGTSPVIDHGFVYSSNYTDPELGSSEIISLGASKNTGVFQAVANRNLATDRVCSVRAYAIAIIDNIRITVYGEPVAFTSMGGIPPAIKSFSPTQGSMGDTILVKGSGFSNILTNNVIKIGNALFSPFKSRPDTLLCIVPGYVSLGDNTFSVSVGDVVATASSKFKLLAVTVSSFAPGTITFLDTLTIAGTNFPRSPLYSTVVMLGKSVTPISASSTKLKVIIPSDASMPGTPFSVMAGVQTVAAGTTLSLFAPTLNSFIPQTGTVNTQLTLTGNFFSPLASANKVELNGKALTILQSGKTNIVARIPSGIAPGNYTFKITVGGQSVISASTFHVF